MSQHKYQRVLLKLSGEALRGSEPCGFDASVLHGLAQQLSAIYGMGVGLGLVVGGGNFVRGEQTSTHMPWFSREAADHIGMLATIMNSIALRELLEHHHVPCTVFSSVAVDGIVVRYTLEAAREASLARRVVIFAGGTGQPFFTTDTTAALRAYQMGADVLIKATNVDGVYDADPRKHSEAKRFDHLSYDQVLTRHLRVMDATGISFCREYRLPILVLNIHEADNLKRAILGEPVGTLIDHRNE